MELLQLVKEAKTIVAFTGAGLSTESGIPDFRSSSGLYLTEDFEGLSPERILSGRYFRANPKVFFAYYIQRIHSMSDKQPNRAHYVLQKMQSKGKLKCVINQNIDNLLQKAGVEHVLDLHGNISQFRCISCCKRYDTKGFEDVYSSVSDKGIPRCDCGGIIRPNIVLFDEALDDQTYDTSYYLVKECDLMIVIGSSCVVRPAATLVGEINDKAKLVIINNMKTPYDHKADLIISDKSCGEVLEGVANGL